MPDELNLEAEEDKTSNPLEGDESSSSDDLEEVFADEEESSSSDTETLAAINQKSGKNFKSLDDVAKSLKQADKLFAEQGQKAKEKAKSSNPDNQPSNNEDVLEEIILVKHPEAEHVLKDIKQIAKSTGRNIMKVYREETWLQEKARAEEKRLKDEGKISSPASSIEGQGYDAKKIGHLSARDKALMARYGLKEKDIKPSE